MLNMKALPLAVLLMFHLASLVPQLLTCHYGANFTQRQIQDLACRRERGKCGILCFTRVVFEGGGGGGPSFGLPPSYSTNMRKQFPFLHYIYSSRGLL